MLDLCTGTEYNNVVFRRDSKKQYSGALHLNFILGRPFYKYFAALQQGIV